MDAPLCFFSLWVALIRAVYQRRLKGVWIEVIDTQHVIIQYVFLAGERFGRHYCQAWKYMAVNPEARTTCSLLPLPRQGTREHHL